MDKLTAAKILAISPDASIEEIRDAYKKLTETVQIDENPAEFARIQTAYKTLVGKVNNVFLYTSNDEYEEQVFALDDHMEAADFCDGNKEGKFFDNNTKDKTDDDGLESFFTEILVKEEEQRQAEADARRALSRFTYTLNNHPASDYDYEKLLELAENCNLSKESCESIADRLTAYKNQKIKDPNGVRRTKGFDEFVGYLYERAGKKYSPIQQRIRDYILIAFFSLEMLLVMFQELTNAFIDVETNSVFFYLRIVLFFIYVAGLLLVRKATDSKRPIKRYLALFVYFMVIGNLFLAVAERI